jgi:hypothetical protein
MPVNDPKVVEMAKLKNAILEVEAQLREEKKITSRLRDNSEKKIKQTLHLDADIATEMESFKWKKEKIQSNIKFLTEETKARLEALSEREMYIKHATAEFDFIVYENEMLHNMIKEVSNEQLKNAAVQAKEREKKSQHNFDARIDMEDVHRHTIMSFNNEYQKEAVSLSFVFIFMVVGQLNFIFKCVPFHCRFLKWNWRLRKQTLKMTVFTQNLTSVKQRQIH